MKSEDLNSVCVVESSESWKILDASELFRYRDMLRFLVWRSVKILYAQSAIGVGWALIQPLFSMVIFTVVFGWFAKLDSTGAPYSLFSLAALVPWTYFSNALLEAGNSLINHSQMLSKVYFPRLILPLSGVLAKLLDFAIAFTLLVLLMVYFGFYPNLHFLALPLLIFLMIITSLGMGIWLTSLSIQYRDVKHALPFLVQLMMYASPVIYTTNIIPVQWRYAFAINPMVGVIEGFRSIVLGKSELPWAFLGIGFCSAMLILTTGLFYFNRQQRLFADVA